MKPKEIGQLNEYHKQRSEAALKAVQEMLKHPLSAKESKEQVKKLNNQSYKNNRVNKF